MADVPRRPRRRLKWSIKAPPVQPAPVFPDPDRWGEQDVSAFIARLSLEEKVALLSGPRATLRALWRVIRDYNREPFVAGAVAAAGLPGIRFCDGPRGVVLYSSTCFPAAIARGATWDPALEARVGDAMGVEARAQGANLFAGICINLLRHPGWGRAQETYGEDPHHVGELGAAMVTGVQRHVMACVKHFAANSIENSRFRVSVEIDERALHEVYLPHFRRAVIDAGAASVMSAYNRLNRVYCGHHRELLTGILRDRWGFEGFVVSDFFLGVRDGPVGLAAGLDLEMPFRWRFGKRLTRAVRAGELPEAAVDTAAGRILGQQVRFARIGEPRRYRPEVVAGPAHRSLAREVAAAGMVLLVNDPPRGGGAPVLPLDPGGLGELAVIGPLADRVVIGDEGSSLVRPPEVATPLAGILAAAPPGLIVRHYGGRRPRRAARLAARAGTAIVVVGYTHADEGEYIYVKGGDRTLLTLSPRDEALIRAVAVANARTVVVMIGGSAIVTEAWRADVPAVLMAWYAGMEGGHALADVLFGRVGPGGKLPCAFPRDLADLPPFDPRANRVTYDLFHGYRHHDRVGRPPAFPFGWGLSYTTFALSPPELERAAVSAEGEVVITLTVTNAGPRPGSEVVQVYAGGPEGSAHERPARVLCAFAKVHLAPGEAEAVRLAIPARRLAVFDRDRGEHVVEPGRYLAWVGTSSVVEHLTAVPFAVVDAP